MNDQKNMKNRSFDFEWCLNILSTLFTGPWKLKLIDFLTNSKSIDERNSIKLCFFFFTEIQLFRWEMMKMIFFPAPLWYDLSVHFQTAVSPVMGANGWPLIYPSNWNEKAFDYAKTFRSLFSLEYRKNVTNNKIYVPEVCAIFIECLD